MFLITKFILPALISAPFFVFLEPMAFLMLAGGIFAGSWLVTIDHVVYFWYGDPADETVQAGKWYLQQKQWFKFVGWVFASRLQPRQLLTRSALFVVILWVLAFYALSSTEQIFGRGFMLGWHLSVFMTWWRWRGQPELFDHQVFWQFAWAPSRRQISYLLMTYLGLMVGYGGLMAWQLSM